MGPMLEKTCDHWSSDSIRMICTPSGLARSTLFYVQEIGAFQTTPPYFTERENLPSFLLILTLSGRGILEVRGQQEELLPGSCMFLDCMEHHRYSTPVGESWEFLWLHFSGAGSPGYFEAFSRSGSHTVFPKDPEGFAGTLRQILAFQKEGTVNGELQSSLCIAQLLTELLMAATPAISLRAAWPGYIKDVVREVEQSFSEDLSLDLLARHNSVSKYHLSREFKRFVGLTLTDFLLRVRLNHAKELLRFTDLPVGQVAEQCGFRDASHFIRMFRLREGGWTPLQYRKQWTSCR